MSPVDKEGTPKATRPIMPAGYGVPKDDKGLLPWSYVSRRLAEAKYYWISTVSAAGQPYANPVDGLWLEGTLYFGGSPQTRWCRNLAGNLAVCVHLESGIEVVTLRGEAVEVRSIERGLAERLSKASFEKYGYGPKPEEYEHPEGMYQLRPRVVIAWSQFPKDVTKWQLT